MKKLISIVTPAFNESGNIEELICQVRNEFVNNLSDYDYEHIIIDNSSTDDTVDIVKKYCEQDKRIK